MQISSLLTGAFAGLVVTLMGSAVASQDVAQQSLRVDKQLFCHDGYVYNSDGIQLTKGSAMPNCVRFIRGSLYCHDGYVFNSDGIQLTRGSAMPNCVKYLGYEMP